MAFILLLSSDFCSRAARSSNRITSRTFQNRPIRAHLNRRVLAEFYDSRHVSFNELFAVGALAKLMTRQPLSVRLISKWTATRSISVLSRRHRDQMTSTAAGWVWYAT